MMKLIVMMIMMKRIVGNQGGPVKYSLVTEYVLIDYFCVSELKIFIDSYGCKCDYTFIIIINIIIVL